MYTQAVVHHLAFSPLSFFSFAFFFFKALRSALDERVAEGLEGSPGADYGALSGLGLAVGAAKAGDGASGSVTLEGVVSAGSFFFFFLGCRRKKRLKGKVTKLKIASSRSSKVSHRQETSSEPFST